MSKPQVVVGIDIEMNGIANGSPVLEPRDEPLQPRRQSHHAGWELNDLNVLLLVAMLIAALTYQLAGQQPPQQLLPGRRRRVPSGDSILRHKHRRRYWLFMTGNWAGFRSSMLMTLALLTGRVPTDTSLFRWPPAVTYSAPKTKLSLDILLWILVLFIPWAAISFEQREMSIPEALAVLKGFARRRFRR